MEVDNTAQAATSPLPKQSVKPTFRARPYDLLVVRIVPSQAVEK